MDAQTFTSVLRGLSGLLPYGSKLDEAQCFVAWQTVPPLVRSQVTNEMWIYAAGQRKLDPSPAQELTLDMQLFRYLFRLENDMPNFGWGLKADLPERMARAHQFNPQPLSSYQLGQEHDHQLKLEGWGQRHEPHGVLAEVFDGNGSQPGRLTSASATTGKWFNLPQARLNAER
jgi:hypothetical protein